MSHQQPLDLLALDGQLSANRSHSWPRNQVRLYSNELRWMCESPVSGQELLAEAVAVRCREYSSESAALCPEVGGLTLIEPG